MKWSDVTLNKFFQLRDLVEIEDETDRVIAIIELLFDIDSKDIPINELGKYIQQLSFLKEEIPNNHIVKKVTVNEHNYTIDALLGHVSTAQYVDFTNYMKEENKVAQVLSVFFIPEGHKYNDGYDMEEVIKDMGYLPVDIAMSESFFFRRQFERFIRTFRSSSIKQLKKTKLPKSLKKKLINAMESSIDLALYPLYSSSVK